MHSSASLAAEGRKSASAPCEAPNRSFESPNRSRVSVLRNELSVCATSSGIVIIEPSPCLVQATRENTTRAVHLNPRWIEKLRIDMYQTTNRCASRRCSFEQFGIHQQTVWCGK